MGSALFVPFEFAFQAAQLGTAAVQGSSSITVVGNVTQWTDAGITVGILHKLLSAQLGTAAGGGPVQDNCNSPAALQHCSSQSCPKYNIVANIGVVVTVELHTGAGF